MRALGERGFGAVTRAVPVGAASPLLRPAYRYQAIAFSEMKDEARQAMEADPELSKPAVIAC
jgi:hypothetical protein